MIRFAKCLSSFRRDGSGATSIEYAIIAAMITLVIVAGVTSLGNTAAGSYENLDEKWDNAAGNGGS